MALITQFIESLSFWEVDSMVSGDACGGLRLRASRGVG